MEYLATLLDEVRSHVHVAGGKDKFDRKVVAATEVAALLQSELGRKGPLTEDAKSEIVSVLNDQHRRLAAWMRRMAGNDLYDSGRYNDFKYAVVEIGFQLAYTSYFPFDWPEGVAEKIRGIGETLHLIDLTEELNKHKGRGDFVKMVEDSESELRSIMQRADLVKNVAQDGELEKENLVEPVGGVAAAVEEKRHASGPRGPGLQIGINPPLKEACRPGAEAFPGAALEHL